MEIKIDNCNLLTTSLDQKEQRIELTHKLIQSTKEEDLHNSLRWSDLAGTKTEPVELHVVGHLRNGDLLFMGRTTLSTTSSFSLYYGRFKEVEE